MQKMQENQINNNTLMMEMLKKIVDKCDQKSVVNKHPEPIEVKIVEKIIDQDKIREEPLVQNKEDSEMPVVEKINDQEITMEQLIKRLNNEETDNDRMNNEIKTLTARINNYEKERTKQIQILL